jgi:hypothetical protein
MATRKARERAHMPCGLFHACVRTQGLSPCLMRALMAQPSDHPAVWERCDESSEGEMREATFDVHESSPVERKRLNEFCTSIIKSD